MDFSSHVDAMFRINGSSVVYTPDGGDPVDVLIIPKRPDEVENFQGLQIVTAKNLFDLRKSEIAQPLEGDLIQWNGQTYAIIGDPVSKDSDRLIWTISAAEQ